MSKILVLKSSIMGPASQTNSLIDAFLSERRQKALHDEIIEHDLTTLELPVLDSELFDALRNGQNLSSRARQVVTLSDQLIAELKKSEILVIGAPMYNLNVPTQLKNWFDLVARAGVTFKYTETYPQGLVEGVKAVVISSRGGIHVDQATDAVTPYLRSVLSLLGINDVEFVYAEGMDIKHHGRDKGIAEARAKILALA
ncbi:NAD(P)H-dependent oxidoreductase [Serratia sp. UGAL515B_01]|uniref:NAD(P)H-dependent oxidoreductase n=1 Tax=Serratia sp. UGAL515B_01 TaxID=2986763 RepID=UPI0029542C56|nr:NAD(P)H-dependent oxidoreductase [Serratia sp. UGAL515B_01]WON77377.1 NAD(P)H-dependent oxidoreductase [Serratia sp. UGAL515B_01]